MKRTKATTVEQQVTSEEYVATVQEQWQGIVDRTSRAISAAAEEFQAAMQAIGESAQKSLEAETAELQEGLKGVVESGARLNELGEQTRKIRASISALHKVTEKPTVLHVEQPTGPETE